MLFCRADFRGDFSAIPKPQKAQGLVAGQPRTSGGHVRAVSNQIVVDQRAGFRNLVQDVADSAEFSTVLMGDKWIDNQQLTLYLVSQRDVTSVCKMVPS